MRDKTTVVIYCYVNNTVEDIRCGNGNKYSDVLLNINHGYTPFPNRLDEIIHES